MFEFTKDEINNAIISMALVEGSGEADFAKTASANIPDEYHKGLVQNSMFMGPVATFASGVAAGLAIAHFRTVLSKQN